MKRIVLRSLAVFIACTTLFAVAGCAVVSGPINTPGTEKTENEEFKLDSICVDDSSADSDGYLDVYMFFEVYAKETISVVTAGNMDLEIDGISYTAEYHGKRNVFTQYDHSLSGKTIRAGSSGKVLAIFCVAPNSLQSSKKILVDSFMPDTKDISFSTDKIVHYNSFNDILKAMDPEVAKGYEPLSKAEENSLLSQIADHYVTFPNGTVYEFNKDYTGKTTKGNTSFSFKYRFTKKYIICESSVGTATLRYEFNSNGELILHMD